MPATVRKATLVVAVLLAELLLALVVVDPRFSRLLVLVVAGVALAAVFLSPFAACVALLIVVGSVFLPGTFKYPVGPLELGIEELTLGALVLVAAVRPRRAWWGGTAGGALAVFLGIVALSGLLATYAGRTDLSTVYSSARPFGMLAMFYVVVRLFPDPRDLRRLLLAAAVVAGVSGAISVLVAAPGSPLAEALNPGESLAIRGDEGLGLVNRVRLPGVAIAYVLFWYAAVRAVSAAGAPRVLWLSLLAGMGVSLILSFNRNMWVGLVVGLVLLFVLGDARTRRRFAAVIVGIAAVGLILGMAAPRVSHTSVLYPIVERASTLLDPGATTREDSLDDRREENDEAISTIEEHPLLGVGAGAPYGAVGEFRLPSGDIVREDQLFIHNQYLYLLLIGGIPGFLAFMVFLGRSLLDASKAVAIESRELLSLGVGVLITMLSATVMISFASPTSAFAVGLLGGAIAVLTSARSGAHPPRLPERTVA